MDTSKNIAKRAQNRENNLLTFIYKATERDQEKNKLISKLRIELSNAVENVDALQAEVKVKEDELSIIKSEKEQLQQLLLSKMTQNKTPPEPTNPTSERSRKKSVKTSKDNVTSHSYHLRTRRKK